MNRVVLIGSLTPCSGAFAVARAYPSIAYSTIRRAGSFVTKLARSGRSQSKLMAYRDM